MFKEYAKGQRLEYKKSDFAVIKLLICDVFCRSIYLH